MISDRKMKSFSTPILPLSPRAGVVLLGGGGGGGGGDGPPEPSVVVVSSSSSSMVVVSVTVMFGFGFMLVVIVSDWLPPMATVKPLNWPQDLGAHFRGVLIWQCVNP